MVARDKPGMLVMVLGARSQAICLDAVFVHDDVAVVLVLDCVGASLVEKLLAELVASGTLVRS